YHVLLNSQQTFGILRNFKKHNIFDMVGMRKHIDWLNPCYLIVWTQQINITSLGSRIATNIYNLLRSDIQKGLYNIFMHPCTWWIRYNNIRMTISIKKCFIKNFLHVTRIKICI